ncbi:ABC transporter substrate-binding protein [Actinoplanes sp. KI2]|uniref:ABC transporter substrate-binding protein n=1 Tax=Actinoplanes sp. KI2 TaxID=2983315 RepID=UPI0021D5A056|nr:ABC transporter substrate-binding protein [Actinoplanes sp. KI2]MCU7723455.1 ABC transporter substrate-binding protein [Actinoplanes sp. KI2]
MLAKPALATFAVVAAVVVGSATLTYAAPTGADSAAAAVPADVRQAGTLVVAAEFGYPPFEDYDDQKKPVGVDVDLATAIAERLQLRLDFRDVPWDDLIPNVTGRKADAIMSAMTDNAERQKQLTYVDYLVEGSQVVVAGGNPRNISGIDGICGRRVALQADTTQDDLAQAQAALCAAAGRKKPTILRLGSDETYPMLKAGKIDAVVDGYTSAASQIKDGGGAFALAGVQVEASPMGIGISRDRTDLRHAVQLALREIIADGTYVKILDKWGLKAEALTTAAIDGGV